MKMNMAWHENTLKNYRDNVIRKRQELERFKADLERTEKDFAFYQKQLETAKAQKKDGFDSERFLGGRA